MEQLQKKTTTFACRTTAEVQAGKMYSDTSIQEKDAAWGQANVPRVDGLSMDKSASVHPTTHNELEKGGSHFDRGKPRLTHATTIGAHAGRTTQSAKVECDIFPL
jgi:hypothetical protein